MRQDAVINSKAAARLPPPSLSLSLSLSISLSLSLFLLVAFSRDREIAFLRSHALARVRL
jgi:hypothetical protein